MFSVGKFFLYFMVHQMSWKLTGRTATFHQSPANTVICSCFVKLDDRKTYFRVNDNITEIFAASGYQEKLSCKPRNFNTNRDPLSWGRSVVDGSSPLLLLSDDSLSFRRFSHAIPADIHHPPF